MKKQNIIDEIFRKKFKDFQESPPEHIFENILSGVRKQPSRQAGKIKNYINNNRLLLSIASVVIIGGIVFLSLTKNLQKDEQTSEIQMVSQTDESSESRNTHNLLPSNSEENPKSQTINTKQSQVSGINSSPGNFEEHNNESDKISVSNVRIDYNVCGNDFKLPYIGSGSNGYPEKSLHSYGAGWNAMEGIKYDNPNDPETNVHFNGSGVVEFIWTENTGEDIEKDTIYVNFFKLPVSNFKIIDSIECIGYPVKLSPYDKSLMRYDWDADEGILSGKASDVLSIYWEKGGNKHNVSLTTWNKYNCKSITTITIEEPRAITIDFQVIAATCNRNNGAVMARASGGAGNYIYQWDSNSRVNSAYIDNLYSGIYEVWVMDENECQDRFSIEVPDSEMVKARFYYSEPGKTTPSEVYYTNTTTIDGISYSLMDGISFEWDFGDNETSQEENPAHIYTIGGEYKVKLYAISASGCIDTFKISDIVIGTTSLVEIPNVFSPNGDGYNDIFIVQTQKIISFQGIILNIKGETLYEWNDPVAGWDGKINRGNLAMPGVYYCIVKCVGEDGRKYEFGDVFHLVRE